MGLEACPTCKKQISVDAQTCPKCGHPLEDGWVENKKAAAKAKRRKQRKWWLIVALMWGFYFLLLSDDDEGMSGYGTNSQTQAPNNQLQIVEFKSEPVKITPEQSLPRLKKNTSPEHCTNRKVFNDWHSQCQRILSYVTVPSIYSDGHPTRLALTYDGHRVSVVGLVPEWYHLKYYTHDFPALAMFDGEKYVQNVYYFISGAQVTVTVGSETVRDLTLQQDAFWVASERASKQLIELFKAGTTAQVSFGSNYASITEADISLIGFSAALDHATAGATTAAVAAAGWPQSESAAILMVSKHIGTNKLGVTRDMLRAKKNPRGLGYYVYSPKTEFWGVTRKIIWFVGNGQVLKLNSPSDLVTPNLPWPREANYTVLDGANLNGVDITTFGISTVFGG